MNKVKFMLVQEREKLFASMIINGEIYEVDATEYFDKANPHDDWLDYRLGLRNMAEKSKFTKNIYQIGDRVRIISAMASDWIGRESEITKVISHNPISYELNIGGGHWLHSMLENIK